MIQLNISDLDLYKDNLIKRKKVVVSIEARSSPSAIQGGEFKPDDTL